MKKKLFWIRTGLLLIILIFAVLGGNFLYTGAESVSPLDIPARAVPLEDAALVQTFTPRYAKVTSLSLALRPPGRPLSELHERMTSASGDLTLTLRDHASGSQVHSVTVSLDGVPDGLYIDFPLDVRLDTGSSYDLYILSENCQEGKNPSLYCAPQSPWIPEVAEVLHLDSGDGGFQPAAAGPAAIRLAYDAPVPARFALFFAALAAILLCMAITVFSSRRKHTGDTEDITLGKILAVRLFHIPLIHILFFAAVTIAAVMIRIAFFPVKSNDYYLCYESWINDMRSSGAWDALGQDIGDYPPLYVTLLTLLSMLPFEPVVIIKLMPCLFDFILALVCVKLAGRLGVSALHRKLLLYAVILLNPLTLLNSAAWGQCDSLHGSMVLLTLLAVCGAEPWSTEPPKGNRHPFRTSGDGICLLFALAFSLKLQAIFFLPILCLLWITQKRNLLKPVQLLWIPIVYTVSCIPMYLAGRSLKTMFKVYLGQADRYYGTLTLNYPNLYTLIGAWSKELYDSYFKYGILLTFLVLIALFYQLYCRKVKLDSLNLCKITALSILIICFCLPLVHERYAYVTEMLLLVIMVKEAEYVKAALATALCTLFTYCTYLMQLEQSFSVLPDQVIALIRLGVIFYLARDIFSSGGRKRRPTPQRATEQETQENL